MFSNTTRTTQIPDKGGRLEFVDVLRGVAILLVIYSHICVLGIHCHSSLNYFFIRFRMPLFFFISGFFAYSADLAGAKLQRRVKSRLTKQLWPTFLVWLLFLAFESLLLGSQFVDTLDKSIFNAGKSGYWFTYSLVQLFLVFALLVAGMRRLKLSENTIGTVFALCAFAMAIGYRLMFNEHGNGPLDREEWVRVLSMQQTFHHGPFFFLGAVVSIWRTKVFRFLGNAWVLGGLLLLTAVSLVGFAYNWIPEWLWQQCAYLYVPTLLGIAYRFRGKFSSETAVGRHLIYLGKNTLPIYLFHYFVIFLITTYSGLHLFRFLPADWITGHGLIWTACRSTLNALLEFAIVATVSLLIAHITLAADRLLKHSPRLHKLVLGN